jgi:hypothetical protein
MAYTTKSKPRIDEMREFEKEIDMAEDMLCELQDKKDSLQKELLVLTSPKPKLKNPQKRIQRIRAQIKETESSMQLANKRVEAVYAKLDHSCEKRRLEAPPEILMVSGKNRSGKTRLLRLLEGWLEGSAGYYKENLPNNPKDEILLLDGPFAANSAKQIEKLAKWKKVILALPDAGGLEFSPKTELNILRINSLDTIPARRATKRMRE